ncbi:uncharacterized protein K489DRAFT_367808 [Dissoconium aciculare CBS 342.82]|uniref:Uncharacterized protein n=1 Tax=Dissoconium aciculare CBS 342.82 TaxID=1314786 RepID=A0A6J3MI84_9PEZI|nr:uncharacterized protein K489DRAFT_367808 [Dissoconium aciculare CBS 342.82]KAF1826617.1 hypothetical protein K489DRAFT_367808 [Dissoconium aciculare CBS 342.82]
MTSVRRMDIPEAADTLHKFVYSGILGSTEGMGFTYSAALSHTPDREGPVDRFRIEVDRETKEASAPEKIGISAEEMQAAVLPAIGETLATSCRFIDGGLSISCKVTTTEKPDLTYVVQIRHHGNVASMDALMKYVQQHSEPGILPMPAVFSIPGEAAHQAATGFGGQMTQFSPGVIAERV